MATNRSNAAAGFHAGVDTYENRMSKNAEWAMSEASLFFEGKGAVQQSFRKIAARLNELKIPYAVVGGLALFNHGFRRYTEDVDILVTRDGLKEIHKALDGLGFIRPFAKSKNLRDVETKVKIEFLIAGDYPGDGKPKDIRFPDPDDVAVERDGVKIINLRTLVELKLASGMSGKDRMKDLADVQEIIKLLDLRRDFSDALHESVRGKYDEIWADAHPRPKRYMTIWRNKFLTIDAKSLDEMIEILGGAVQELKDMRADGVTLDPDGGTADDYAYLVTTDSVIAKKYGMEDESEFWDEDEDAEEGTE